MKINSIKNANELTLTLEGKLDTVTSPQLEEEIKKSINGVEKLVFDFSDLIYISSAGLRVLLTTQDIMDDQGQMVIKNASEAIMEVFEVTGFVDILTIE